MDTECCAYTFYEVLRLQQLNYSVQLTQFAQKRL